MEKYLIALLPFCFIGFALPAQNARIDSLLTELDHHPSIDSSRMVILGQIGEEYLRSGSEKTDSIAKVLLQNSRQIQWEKGEKKALILLADKDINTGNWNGALLHLQELLDLNRRLEDQESQILCLNKISGVHYRAGDLDKAVEYADQALSKSKANSSETYLGRIYTTLGAIHMGWGRESNRSETERDSLFDLSIQHFEGALKVAQDQGNKFGVAMTGSNMSAVFMLQGKAGKALEYAQVALNTHQEMGNLEGEITSSINVGESYLRLKRFQEAVPHFENAHQLSRKHHFTQFELNALGSLSTAHRRLGNTEEALSYLDQHYMLKDSLFSVEKIEALAAQSEKYENEKTEEQNEWLSQRNEILVSRNFLLIIYGAILLILMVILIVLLLRLRKQNRFISQQAAQVKELDEVRTRLFGIIAHDLRNPVIAFRGIVKKVNYLVDEGQFDRLQQFNKQLNQASESLSGLLDNLLKWALTQRGALPYHPQTLSLAESFQEVIGQMNTIAQEKMIDLQLEIPDSLHLYADRESTLVIIRNLLDNAIKYSFRGGTVSMEGWQENGHVKFKVVDQGKGIEENHLGQLFKPGVIPSHQGTSGEKGAGLGLSVVWELVRINKGNIEVNSELGKGTNFLVKLPSASTQEFSHGKS